MFVFNPAPTVTLTGAALLDRILVERRIELWGEGFRLRDIKRLKIGLLRNPTVGTVRGHTPSIALHYDSSLLSSNLFIYQLPQNEIDNNPQIGVANQNP